MRLALPFRFLSWLGTAAVLAGLTVWMAFGRGGMPAPAAAPLELSAPGEEVEDPEAPPIVRLSGTVEAVRGTTIVVPRLAGQSVNSLVITALVPAGTPVQAGDLLVEFDPQQQLRNAMDRRAEVVDLDGQIAKKRADQAIARAADETAIKQAEHDFERARLELGKNEFIPAVEAEKNELAFEQASARLAQLREAVVLKQRAAGADLRILEIRRERSERELRHAEENARLMTVRATFPGVAVLKSIYRGNGFVEVQEGDEVRPGLPIVEIVDPSVMRVRARVNQADIAFVQPGRPAVIGLDAYPELRFNGRVEVVTPLGVTSGLTATVHTFTTLVSIDGAHSQLMPDLTALVDVETSADLSR